MEEVLIICPELSAGRGGVADYTLRMVGSWRGAYTVRFLLPAGVNPDPPASVGWSIDSIARTEDALRARLPRAGKVLVQYSAYGFDHYGFPRWLLGALTDWKANAGGTLVIMFHEIWTFWPIWNKNYLIQKLHRRSIRKLLSKADVVFTSTASQAEHLRSLGRSGVEVLPVGSGVRQLASEASPKERGLAVIFGLQQVRINSIRSMQIHLRALAAAGKIDRIITVGAGESTAGTAEERSLLGGLALRNGFETRGCTSEIDVSTLLTRAEFALSAQDPLSLTKSSSFMAYAAHRLNVISPFADGTKPAPISCLIHPDEVLRGLPPDVSEERSEQLRAWQEQTSSWGAIGERFARALQLPESNTTTPPLGS